MQTVSIAIVTRKDGVEVRWVNPNDIPALFTTNLDSKTTIYLHINSKIE